MALAMVIGGLNAEATTCFERTAISVESLKVLKSGMECDKKAMNDRLINSLLALDNCKKAEVAEGAIHSVELQGAFFVGAVQGIDQSIKLLDYMVDVLEGKVELE